MIKNGNCCYLSQVVEGGTWNCANNKELIQNYTQSYFYFIFSLRTHIFNGFYEVKPIKNFTISTSHTINLTNVDKLFSLSKTLIQILTRNLKCLKLNVEVTLVS